MIGQPGISTEGAGNGAASATSFAQPPPGAQSGRGRAPGRQVGEPLTLIAFAKDPDNIPARRGGRGGFERGAANAAALANSPVPTSLIARPRKRTGPAAVWDCLPRQGRNG